MQVLNIPKRNKTRGLYVFCKKCKTKSTSTLKNTKKCNHPAEYLAFRAIIAIPGTRSIASRVLETRDLNDAIKQTIEFEEELKQNDYASKKDKDLYKQLPEDLIGCISMYVDYIEDKNVYEHQKRFRSEEHVKSIIRYLKDFILSLKEAGIKVDRLLIKYINDNHVAIFHNYILNQKAANRTYNRMLDTISEFFKYLIDFKNYDLKNYFSSSNIKRKPVVSRIDTITKDEFKKMCCQIKPENGTEILSTGEKKYHYYPWLIDAFEIALLTGLRRDGIINLKFSDIIEQDNKPIIIRTEDFKYNRRYNLVREEEKKYNYAPVIFELGLVLQKLGYLKYRNSDRYIIAPESTRGRKTMKDDLSKAFSHYYTFLGTEKKLGFKHLRKTYITMLNNFTNGKAHKITGHSGQQVILKHYQDPTVANEVIEGFRLIS